MNKFSEFFGKRKRSQGNYNVYDVSRPHYQNNRHPFDSDNLTCNSSKLGREILINFKAEETSNSQDSTAEFQSSSHLITSAVTFDSQRKRKLQITKNSINLNSNGAFEENLKKKIKSPLEEKEKCEKNIFLINISNSKCFHIGSQKTFRHNEKQSVTETETIEDCKATSWITKFSPQIKIDFLNLIDCEKKLTERCILLISQNVDNKWKEFVKYLGFPKTVLDALEFRNKNYRIFCVYDALHKYIIRFPNTSLSFVIYALCETHQSAVIEKLAQELKT